MADRIGQQLGNYQLIRLLGEGGFAEVYLGEHIHLGTQAAIKVLHTQLTDDDMRQFRTEARTIARLEHPHIVRILDFGVENKTPFLVMSFAPHGTLRQRHTKGTHLSPLTIVSYIKQVADALQYAHDEKLIHRDIKPENMLLGRRNEVLLSDFGIAVAAQSSRYQSTQDVIGTVVYMAPEQIQGKPRPASDQYSLGIVVYEWISGDRPFHGSFTELCTQHLFAPPPPLNKKNSDVSYEVDHVVQRALAKDPRERFASVQAFATALEQAYLLAQGSPSISYSQPLPPTIAAIPLRQPFQTGTMINQPIKHHLSRRTVVLGLAGLVVTVGGLTWLAASRSSSDSAIKPPSDATSTTTPNYTVDFSDNQLHNWQVDSDYTLQDGYLTVNVPNATSTRGAVVPFNALGANYIITFRCRTNSYFHFDVEAQPSGQFFEWGFGGLIFTDHMIATINDGQNPSDGYQYTEHLNDNITYPASTDLVSYKFIVQQGKLTFYRNDIALVTGRMPTTQQASSRITFSAVNLQIKDLQIYLK